MTKGTGDETFDKICLDWFQRTANGLKTNKFKFCPARRIEMPKPNSTKKLTIGSPREKIVQRGILLILQAI